MSGLWTTATADVYRRRGYRTYPNYWHGHSRDWYQRHHYRWSGGEWVIIPGYDIAPVYEYGYGHPRYYRGRYWHHPYRGPWR